MRLRLRYQERTVNGILAETFIAASWCIQQDDDSVKLKTESWFEALKLAFTTEQLQEHIKNDPLLTDVPYLSKQVFFINNSVLVPTSFYRHDPISFCRVWIKLKFMAIDVIV